ncbi:MAG: ABC transporter [Nitrospirae bacterium RBG_16_64_22]|nr:MAG: ABC transporter [Nitrospirae bacterium RBG_16_64_22]
MEPIIRVSCIRHTYPDRTSVHLCGLDFVVPRGRRVVVLGPNGSGKTTLLSHILGLLAPDEGTVRVLGVDPAREFSRIRERIGVVFQNVDQQIIGPTVYDDVSFSPRNYGYTEKETERMADEIMDDLGIAPLRDKICHYLSGGEKRKVALAGALVLRPDLLVLDEPFEGLDPRSKGDLVALLGRIHRERGMTIVLSTHDINIVPPMADEVYLLAAGGEIRHRGKPAEIFAEPARLREVNLEAPILTEVFQGLRERGIRVSIPITPSEAIESLLALLKEGRGEGMG